MKKSKIAVGGFLALTLACGGMAWQAAADQAGLSPRAEAAQASERNYENKGLRLRIPGDYDGLLLVEKLQDAEGDIFSVSYAGFPGGHLGRENRRPGQKIFLQTGSERWQGE